MAVNIPPVVLLYPAWYPTAVLSEAVVLNARASLPTAVLFEEEPPAPADENAP